MNRAASSLAPMANRERPTGVACSTTTAMTSSTAKGTAA